MKAKRTLLDCYLPPDEGFVLDSLVATTYEVNFEFFEEELLAVALGVRSPVSRMKAFRSELERRLQTTDVTVLYDLSGCARLARLSPRIDPVPIATRKLHAKISLLLWSRPGGPGESSVERRMRLIVGSANLTRQGFRENYECVDATDFGGRKPGPRALLESAIALVRNIANETRSNQLAKQLNRFETEAARLPAPARGVDDPLALVSADDLLPTMKRAWSDRSGGLPKKVTIVSPFWPEGGKAAEALAGFIGRFGQPGEVELICRGAFSTDGKTWLPEFDAGAASALRGLLSCRLFLRPALPDYGTASDEGNIDPGDETEERDLARRIEGAARAVGAQRSLHAKIILIESEEGAVLYVGSSNCTRRGLGLGGASNWEAGLLYWLGAYQRKQCKALFSFAGAAVEVFAGEPIATVPPQRSEDCPSPAFLSEVVACGSSVTIRFRPGFEVPDDLVILMEVPSASDARQYWLLYHRDVAVPVPDELALELFQCPLCNERLETMAAEVPRIVPHIQVEVRWAAETAFFPVRFDDKATLPLLLLGRKPTEGELIDYFLFGREPDDGGDGTAPPGKEEKWEKDEPIDTRHILAYFIRRFVQAIPGIEAEIARASYSATALASALRGPTSPLALAEHTFASLTRRPDANEPVKTPTAVCFQLVEILAAILRARGRITDPECSGCFEPVAARCEELIGALVAGYPELQGAAFQLYRRRFGEVVP